MRQTKVFKIKVILKHTFCLSFLFQSVQKKEENRSNCDESYLKTMAKLWPTSKYMAENIKLWQKQCTAVVIKLHCRSYNRTMAKHTSEV